MPHGLVRYQKEGDDHFITFSCHDRKRYLNTPPACDIFLKSLEATRKRYNFEVLGYVIMPEHVHLLLGEPEAKPLATALQALKLSVSKLSTQRPFWLPRYYDFNVTTHNKRIEKLHYMHNNPVARGLVSAPEDWPYSSYRHRMLSEPSPVQITQPGHTSSGG
jgi:putative transposase